MSRVLLIGSIILVVGSSGLFLSRRILELPATILFWTKVSLRLSGAAGTLTALGFRRCLGKKRASAVVVNLTLFVATTAFSLVISEFALRVIFRNITSTADNKSYFAQRWRQRSVSLNTWGFRERQFELIKPDHIYRIAVIGDSFTFGQGIAEKDRFTNLLEASLNQRTYGFRYEVLNFGKCGAETIDHLVILKDIVLKARPDFVLLQWYVNDFEGHDKTAQPKCIPLVPSSTVHRILYRSSALYYLASREWNSIQKTFGLSGSYENYMLQRFGDPQSPESRQHLQLLKDFVELCKLEQTPVGLVLFPDAGPYLETAYPFDYLYDRVFEFSRQEDIVCLDLRSAFHSRADYTKLRVNQFDDHPSSLANRLAAELLMITFGEVWLSPGLGNH